MLNKKERTLDVYKEIGAYVRLCKAFLSKLVVQASQVNTVKENAKLKRALDIIFNAGDDLESKMFEECAGLSPEHEHIFRGDIDCSSPRDMVDAGVLHNIKHILDDMCHLSE